MLLIPAFEFLLACEKFEDVEDFEPCDRCDRAVSLLQRPREPVRTGMAPGGNTGERAEEREGDLGTMT